jgi:hypothetical protein
MQRETIGIRLWRGGRPCYGMETKEFGLNVAIDFNKDRNISYQLSTFA